MIDLPFLFDFVQLFAIVATAWAARVDGDTQDERIDNPFILRIRVNCQSQWQG